jgi:hypothetical protein
MGEVRRCRARAARAVEVAGAQIGAPDGEYVVLKYDTVFDKKEHAVETVTPMKDADGLWRVSGYFIR